MRGIQLSCESYSCFLSLPIEIKQSPISDCIVISTDQATWTVDRQRIQANSFDSRPPVVTKRTPGPAYNGTDFPGPDETTWGAPEWEEGSRRAVIETLKGSL